LSQASATFVEMADEYVLGTHRLSTAQERADKDVQVTTKSVQTQGTALKDQGAAASTATHQTTQLSAAQQDLNKAFEDANTAASKLKGTLEKLKLGDVMKAISTVELSNAVGAVMEDLQTMEASGKFSARQIAKAYEDAAAVLRERFGFLPGVFQQAFDRMRAQALNTEDGVVLAFERMGVKIRGDLQQTAREALNDFQAILDSGGAVPRELLDVYLDVLDQIDKAGFQRLPENFQAVNQRMLDVARKAGVDLPQPYVDAFGQIATAGKQAAEAIDLSWLQSRGVLERARGTVEDLAESVVKLSDETQRLMDLQISVETRFASDVPGLLKQYNQAVKELYNLQSNVITMAGGAPGERDFRINQQLEIIKAIIAALAKLGVNELGQALPGTTGGGMGGGGIPTSGGAGSITTGGIPSRTTGIPSASSPYQAVPSAPLGGTSIQSAPLPTSTTQRTYTMYIQTQATDAATLARDLVPYLRQSDLSPRPLGG
jgi:hypothetical protein